MTRSCWCTLVPLLTSSREGKTAYIDADLRDPAAILGAEETRQTFDLGQPVALSLIAILQFITDDNEAYRIIDQLIAALPRGSVLALSTVTADSAPGEVTGGVAAYNANGIPAVARDKAEVEFFFRGLDLVEPGVTLVSHWWPDERTPDVADAHVHVHGGIAVKR